MTDLRPVMAAALLALALFQLGLAFLLLRRRRGRPRGIQLHGLVIAAALGLAAAAAGSAYALDARGLPFDLAWRLTWVQWLVVPALVQVAMHLRPSRGRAGLRWGWLLYPLWGLIVALAAGTDLVATPPRSLVPFDHLPGPVEMPVRALGGLLALWAVTLLDRAHGDSPLLRRRAMRAFAAACAALAFAQAVIGAELPALLGLPVDPALAALFGLPWLLGTLAALSEQRVFGRAVAWRDLAFFGAAWGGGALGLLALHRLLSPALGGTLALLVSQGLVLGVAFLSPLEPRMRAAIARLSAADRQDPGLLAGWIARRAAEAEDGDMAVEAVLALARDRLGLRAACLFAPAGEDPAGGWAAWGGFGVNEEAALALVPAPELRAHLDAHGELDAETGLPDGLMDAWTPLGRLGMRRALALRHAGRMVGLLAVGGLADGAPWNEEDRRALAVLAGALAPLLEAAAWRERAEVDEETGLPRPSALRERLRAWLAGADAEGAACSAVALAVDDLARVERDWGLAVAAEVLRRVGRRVRSELGAQDVASHRGRGEILMLLPGTTGAGARLFAERLRRAIAAELAAGGVTLSAGVASVEDGVPGEQLLDAAAAALAEARLAGGDQLVAAGSAARAAS